MRVRGRRLPTHPVDLIQWSLTVQPALMKQTRLQDASIPENVKNPLKAPSGSPAKSLRLASATVGRLHHRPESLHRMTHE